MPIVTISRGSYSKGKEVAEMVARCLGYDCISREVILEASDRFNVPEIKLVRAIHDAPSILERFSHNKQVYIAYIQAALASRVAKDNVVYHGLAGHLLLRGLTNTLKVRIIADISDRVAAEMEREQISEAEARALLLKDDEERRKWTKALYHVDPWDPTLYDLVICVHRLTVRDAAEIICDTAKRKQFQTTREARRQMEDLATACRIKAALIDTFPDIRVSCEYGNVLVYTHSSGRQLHKLEELVKQLEKKEKGINNLEVRSSTSAPDRAV